MMLLDCGAREDSWESLEQQGDQTSQSYRKSTLNIPWKDWCWSWSSNTLATWSKSQLIRKYPNAGKDGGQEEKGKTEDEMVRWHHWLNGHEFDHAPADGKGLGSLVCCSPWVAKSWTQLSNWTTTTATSLRGTRGRRKWFGALDKHPRYERENTVLHWK